MNQHISLTHRRKFEQDSNEMPKYIQQPYRIEPDLKGPPLHQKKTGQVSNNSETKIQESGPLQLNQTSLNKIEAGIFDFSAA